MGGEQGEMGNCEKLPKNTSGNVHKKCVNLIGNRRKIGQTWDNLGEITSKRLLDQAQAQVSYTPPFGGRSHSIPQRMVSDVEPLVKSSF